MINLPERFKQKLTEDNSTYLNGIINLLSSKYEIILAENNLEFFPEYTNHGINHINELLASSDNLIPQDSFNLLTSL